MMNVQFLEEGRKKKFAVIPYAEFVKLVEMAADTSDYHRAVAVLNDASDPIRDYNPAKVLENPIARMREKKGLTQVKLASLLKVHPSYLSRLEKRGSIPSNTLLDKIATVLKCNIDELLY